MSSLLICDAGPLIVLAKLGVLTKWFIDLGYPTVVLDVVVAELKRGPFGYKELEEIGEFLKQAKVIPCPKFKSSADSLSLQDQASLLAAEERPSSILLADDRLLRRAAQKAGVKVIGFIGILIQATRMQLLSAGEALNLVDEAIEIHNYRISISLYQALQKQLREFK